MNEFSSLKALKSFVIIGATTDEAKRLNLLFKNTTEAQEFAKTLSSFKRIADTDLGHQGFTLTFPQNESVNFSGNLNNAIKLIVYYKLIDESSLKKHIYDTDVNRAVENSKNVVIEEKKAEKEKYREKTPEQLVSTFSIAISQATEKKSASCFCVRRNKK